VVSLGLQIDAFPRFSFLSPSAVLECLALGLEPQKVLPLVVSAFDGLGDLLWAHSDAAKRSIAAQLQAGEKARDKALQKLEKPALVSGPWIST
jgi:hypothetical protein